jgi:acylphosphatase
LVPTVMYLGVRKITMRNVPQMMVRAHVYVSGRVQGVFFRAQTRNNAIRRNITGWVRNLADGRVEAVFEGEKSQVDQIIEFCKRGPTGAHVQRLDVTWEDYTGEFSEFTFAYGR